MTFLQRHGKGFCLIGFEMSSLESWLICLLLLLLLQPSALLYAQTHEDVKRILS